MNQKITVIHLHKGFCNVLLDGKLVGIVEDPEEFAVVAMLTNLMKAMGLEVDIESKREK